MKLFIVGLSLVFIALKLTGDISWAWWIVLSPIWGPPIGFAVVVALFAIFSSQFRHSFSVRYRELRAERKAKETLDTFIKRKNDDHFEA